jgi:hypothetical protein
MPVQSHQTGVRIFLSALALLLIAFISLSVVIAQQISLSKLVTLRADGLGPFAGDSGSGTLKGTIGNTTGIANYSFQQFSGALQPNGQGAFCAFRSGTFTITTTEGSILTLNFAGTGCDATGPVSPWVVDSLTYIITSGTGRFAGATGTGNLSIGKYFTSGGSTVTNYVHLDGNISS